MQFNVSNEDANVIFGNTPNSRITGCKFQDVNRNGYRDGFEKPIAGVTIYLDSNGNDALDAGEASTVSNQFGGWEFGNLTPGIYRVREVQQPNFRQTTQPLDIVLGANQTFTCALVGNDQDFTINERVPKFRDDNRNGIQDPGEPPLEGIPFTLDFNRNGRYDPGTEPLVRSDANGIALFTNLTPGTYSLLEVFNAPGVPNPFPIPTGPNPVPLTVPGPNSFVTPIVPAPIPTEPERAIESIDELTGQTVTASSIPDPLNNPDPDRSAKALGQGSADNLLVPEIAGVSSFVRSNIGREVSSLVLSFLEEHDIPKKDSKLLLGESTSGAWL